MLSLDTSPGIITKTLFQGAVLAGCRAIVQSRWDELPDFPAHPRIYKIQKVPHQYIFPSCSAVVHHGGAGTTHSATRHGCPSVVIEHFGDQAFFARELQSLGVAPKVLHRRNITATKLARAIRIVLDSPDMRKKAEELSGLMRKENGVKKAVELIENRFASQ
jgi:UDP:flavonoid glycosyltransferase YjiC (YdhE family)